jgi:hypothetical protein
MKTVIDGVEITPSMVAVLKEWDENNDGVQSPPERYVSHLSDIQDFLCYQLDVFNDFQKVKQLILHTIYIKDDLKRFINNAGCKP